jgi:hypothetical protein
MCQVIETTRSHIISALYAAKAGALFHAHLHLKDALSTVNQSGNPAAKASVFRMLNMVRAAAYARAS